MTRLEIAWLAISIALTTATQLRVTSVVGPGEIMVALWILFASIRILSIGQAVKTPIKTLVLRFWIVAFLALTCGSLIAYFKEMVSPSFYHDAFALTFVCAFSIIFAASIPSQNNLKKLLSIFLGFVIVIQVIIFFLPSIVPFLSPWFGDSRFQGWSNNPNQMGLLASTLPFFSLHLFRQSYRASEKGWYGVLIAGSLMIGNATQSDSFRVGCVLATLVIVISVVYRSITRYITACAPLSSMFSKIAAQQISLIVLLAIAALTIYLSREKIYTISMETYSYGAQGEDRMTLWKNGIAAILQSPIFGLGPGSHSGETEPLYYNLECHNTFIDWATSTGLVGLTAYVFLLGWVSWNAWRNGFITLVAAFAALIGFTFFGYMMRHIVFWFYLLTIANLSLRCPRFKAVLES